MKKTVDVLMLIELSKAQMSERGDELWRQQAQKMGSGKTSCQIKQKKSLSGL